MKVRWLGDITGANVHPVWEVKRVRFHTVKNMLRPDGTRQDTCVVYFQVNDAQINKLIEDYGKDNLPINILGMDAFPLFPNAVLWKWNPPKGYEGRVAPQSYTAFEIIEEEEE